MGGDDVDGATVANVLLCCVSSYGLSRYHGTNFTEPGMHCNLFLNGVLGILHHQSARLGINVAAAYRLSLAATKYLPIPCLNGDLYRYDNALSTIHVVSGFVPFAIALTGKEDKEIGHLIIALNVISLAFYSFRNKREWGWFTAAAACLCYFATPQMGDNGKVVYPLTLALMEYCAFRVFHIHVGAAQPGPGSAP